MIGQLLGQLGKANHLSVIVVQGGNENASPKQGAIFSNPPSNVAGAPFLFGQFNQLLGQAKLPVLRHIKQAEILPNDLSFFVAFNFFCTSVPGQDYAINIEQDD
jgi:hypothetical protein